MKYDYDSMKPRLTELVTFKLSADLRSAIAAKAESSGGVPDAQWARSVVLSNLDASSAKAPQPAGGGNFTIRFRPEEHKRVVLAARRSGRTLSDLIRGILAKAAR